MACTEMISSEALVRQHRESFRLMDLGWDHRPVSVQLMGGDPGVMAQAAQMAERAGADIVDINMGCPVPKVVKTSGGSSLLRDPDRACRVAEAVVGAVSVPVTVKIRLGWDFASRNYLEMATRLETTGIQGLAVHGRTRSQRYDPSAALRLSPEARRLYERASFGAQSVAELSAHCGVSLGVTRVLLEDLAAADHVQINEEAYASPYDHRLLKRVIDGLREFG